MSTYLKPLLAVAAVIVIAVVGCEPAARAVPRASVALAPRESRPPTPSPTPAPTPAPDDRGTSPDMDIHGVRSLPWTGHGPGGWDGPARGSWLLHAPARDDPAPPRIAVAATGAVIRARSDPCDARSARFRTRRVPADVVAALGARDDHASSRTRSTSRSAGTPDTRVDVEGPADLSACDGSDMHLRASPTAVGSTLKGRSNLLRLSILDVRGSPDRLLDHQLRPGTPADDMAEASRSSRLRVRHHALIGRRRFRRRGSLAYRFPRFSCSRSIASNSALKLPTPKPREPWRSMISKKNVGRSWTGRVKIWRR